MSIEENKAIASRSIELWNTGNLVIVDELYAKNFVSHGALPK